MKKELILDVLDAQRVSDGKYVSSYVELGDKDRFIVNKIIYIEIVNSKDNSITDDGDMIVFSFVDSSKFEFDNNTKLVYLKTIAEVDSFDDKQETKELIFSYVPCYFDKITDEGELLIIKSMIEECTEFIEK